MPVSNKEKSVKGKKEFSFKPRKLKIRVVGIGGGGVSIVSEIAPSLKNVSFVAADTDGRVFQKARKGVKVFQFGVKLAKGAGTGMDFELAQRAAMEDKDKIAKIFQDQDIIILIGCLGGGVGSGAGSVFAEIAKAEKAISLGIFTLPFNFEGERKMNMAKKVIERLRENLSGIIIVPNEKIFQLIDKKTPLKKALSTLNQIFARWLVDWIEVIFHPSLINIDFADLRTILQGHGASLFLGQGIGQGSNRTDEVVKNIFGSSLLGGPSETIKRILLNITGGKDLGIKEVEIISNSISRLNPRAKIIFGITEDIRFNGKIKATVMIVSEPEKKFHGNEPPLGKLGTKQPNATKNAVPKNRRNDKKKNGSTEQPDNRIDEPIVKKEKVRQTALEVRKAEKEEVEKELAGNAQWEVPAFLLKKME